jgi:hypothetical protein
MLVVIGTDCTGTRSCISIYHMIMTMTAPKFDSNDVLLPKTCRLYYLIFQYFDHERSG